MTEPTTQELIDWLDEYARKQAVFAGDELGEDPLVASRIKMLRAIAERLRAMQAREAELRYTIEQQKQAMQWRKVTDEWPAVGQTIFAAWPWSGAPTEYGEVTREINFWMGIEEEEEVSRPTYSIQLPPLPQPPEGER